MSMKNKTTVKIKLQDMQETETVPTITQPDSLMVGDSVLSPAKEEGGGG
jgi:hypothetical protein